MHAIQAPCLYPAHHHQNHNTSQRPTLCASAVLVALATLVGFATQAATAQTFDLRDDLIDDSPPVEHAIECLRGTEVRRFSASPSVVEPFEATTVSWNVVTPPNCRSLSLLLAGQRVDHLGSTSFTPVKAETSLRLDASMAGSFTTLARTEIQVDQSTCSVFGTLEFPVLRQELINAITAFDERDPDFRQTAPPDAFLDGERLFITIFGFVDGGHPALSASVTLEMGLRFTVVDGVISPRYVLYRPIASAPLPDDVFTSKFYDKSDEILADFRTQLNQRFASLFPIPDNRQLFDLVIDPPDITAIVCAVEPPSRPKLNIELRVTPNDDPGRFTVLLDGRSVLSNARHGASTEAIEVTPGSHSLSHRVLRPAELSDYRTIVGGSCSSNGTIVLAEGQDRTCTVSHVRRAPDSQSCQQECRNQRDTCMADRTLRPAICTALLNRCLASCN